MPQAPFGAFLAADKIAPAMVIIEEPLLPDDRLAGNHSVGNWEFCNALRRKPRAALGSWTPNSLNGGHTQDNLCICEIYNKFHASIFWKV